jgi:hypothetical protein
VSGSATGTFTITGSTTFSVTAIGPSGTLVGGIPAIFIPTTVTVEAVSCGAVTSALQTTCSGTTVGNPLQGATITVRFPLAGGSTSDVLGTVNTTLTPTPTTTSLTLAQAIAQVAVSGQSGLVCAATVGSACTASGSVSGTGSVVGSMTWSLTATVPSGAPVGVTPVAVFTTTIGLEGFVCPILTAGATSLTCTGTTTGNALQGSTVTVVFGTSFRVAGTITGPGSQIGNGFAGVLPPPLPVGPLPLGGGPVGPGPLIGGPVGAAPLGGAPLLGGPGGPPPGQPPPLASGPLAEVPVVPEANSGWLLLGGLAALGLAGGVRRQRARRGHADQR